MCVCLLVLVSDHCVLSGRRLFTLVRKVLFRGSRRTGSIDIKKENIGHRGNCARQNREQTEYHDVLLERERRTGIARSSDGCLLRDTEHKKVT